MEDEYRIKLPFEPRKQTKKRKYWHLIRTTFLNAFVTIRYQRFLVVFLFYFVLLELSNGKYREFLLQRDIIFYEGL